MYRNWFFCWSSLRIVAAVCFSLLGMSGFAAWHFTANVKVESKADFLLPIVYKPAQAGSSFTPRTLWLYPDNPLDVLVPETVEATSANTFIPVFFRTDEPARITIVDGADRSTSTIEVKPVAPGTPSKKPWLAYLRLRGEDELPVSLANQATTAVLELTPGTGPMPPTTHISAVDHKGRMVVSKFYKTFELTAGSETFALPTAGEYELTLKLIDDPYTSMPRARYRNPIPIEFGEVVSKFETTESIDGVTTDAVFGIRVALEHQPTTATVVSVDRLRAVALGRHSNEMQRNRWPFVLKGTKLIEMSKEERESRGVRLLRWQRRLGSSYAPVLVDWSDVQASPGSFKWSRLNQTLPMYRRGLVRPLVTLTGRAAWNNELPTQTTETLSAWKHWVSELGDEFRNVTWGILIWDNPEKIWQDPADYIDLLMASADGFQYRDGKRIPSSSVVTGALEKYDSAFLDAVLTPEVTKRLDAIAFDLYPEDKKAGPEQNQFHDRFVFSQALLRRKDATHLETWITGTGWPVGPDGVTSRQQANFLVRTHVSAFAAGINKVFWDTLQDDPVPGGSVNIEQNGLLRPDFVPNASGVAYNIMTYLLSGGTTPTVTRQGNATITSFNLPLQSNKWPGIIYVAWTGAPQENQTIKLDLTHGGGAYALDYLGAEVPMQKIAGDPVDPIAGTYTVPVGYEPVYIWDAGKRPARTRQGPP